MQIGRRGRLESLLFTAASWVIAIGAVISYLRTGTGVMANYAPIVLWCVLVAFAVIRLGRPTFWLLLPGPIAVLFPVLWVLLIVVMCYMFPQPRGCF
jgi:hypothetical protein